MLEFFSTLIDFFVSIGHLLTNLLTGVAYIFALIPQGISFITYSIGFLPSVLVAFAFAGVSICVLFNIIGR